jgi:hypothetical protein
MSLLKTNFMKLSNNLFYKKKQNDKLYYLNKIKKEIFISLIYILNLQLKLNLNDPCPYRSLAM